MAASHRPFPPAEALPCHHWHPPLSARLPRKGYWTIGDTSGAKGRSLGRAPGASRHTRKMDRRRGLDLIRLHTGRASRQGAHRSASCAWRLRIPGNRPRPKMDRRNEHGGSARSHPLSAHRLQPEHRCGTPWRKRRSAQVIWRRCRVHSGMPWHARPMAAQKHRRRLPAPARIASGGLQSRSHGTHDRGRRLHARAGRPLPHRHRICDRLPSRKGIRGRSFTAPWPHPDLIHPSDCRDEGLRRPSRTPSPGAALPPT